MTPKNSSPCKRQSPRWRKTVSKGTEFIPFQVKLPGQPYPHGQASREIRFKDMLPNPAIFTIFLRRLLPLNDDCSIWFASTL